MKRFLVPLIALFFLPLPVHSRSYEVEEDLMNDTKTIYSFLDSENLINNSIGVPTRGILMIRCSDGKPSLVFQTPTYNADNRSVGVRWNKETANYYDWNKSTSSDAYFHRKPKDFINEMRERDTLTLAWQPYQRSQEAVKFDLNSQNWKQDIEQAIKDGCKL